MEVVAGVASVVGVVGILGIVGDALQGILKVKESVHDASTASRTVKSFLDAIENLQGLLTAISDLLNRVPEGSRRVAFERCRVDIAALVREIPKHNANSLTAKKSIFKKLLVASHETAYKKFHRCVERHLVWMQLSLSVLGRSYDAHISKQGNVIAEQVKSAAEAQTCFHQVSMEEFGKIDDGFVTRLDPVSSQLDRLESSSQTSEASMSSLASDVSRMLEILSSNPALATSARFDEVGGQLVETDTNSAGHTVVKRMNSKRKKPRLSQQRQQVSLIPVEWSCELLPGIEAAFSASGSVCLYCGDVFEDASTDWSIKGRHLVDEHRYGECNVLLSYDSEEKFTQHIQQFHHCCLDYDKILSKKFLMSHFRYGQKQVFHRGMKSETQHLTDDLHDLNSPRWGSVFDYSTVSNAMHEHCGGMKVPFRAFAPGKPPVQRPLEPDIYNALLAEGCIVDGLMIASISPRSSISRFGDEVTMPCFSPRDSNEFSTGERRHLVPLLEDSLKRLRVTSSKVVNVGKRINAWLQGILTSSSTTRTILFHTLKTADPIFSNMNTWLEKVLEFWDSDEAATKADEPATKADEPEIRSEGALDSRGSPEIRNVRAYEYDTVPHGIQAQQELRMPNKRSGEYDPVSGFDAFENDEFGNDGLTRHWIDRDYDKRFN